MTVNNNCCELLSKFVFLQNDINPHDGEQPNRGVVSCFQNLYFCRMI